MSLLEIRVKQQYHCPFNLWGGCTLVRKRYTNLVPLPLSLSTPTDGNNASIRPMLFSKREKYYNTNNDYNTVITRTKIKVNIQYNYLCLFPCSTLHIYKYCAKRHIFVHTLQKQTDDENHQFRRVSVKPSTPQRRVFNPVETLRKTRWPWFGIAQSR